MMKLKYMPGTYGTLLLYLFINSLFIYKYFPAVFPHPAIPITIYVLTIFALIIVNPKISNNFYNLKITNGTYYLAIIVIALLLLLLMNCFNPAFIDVTRFPAINHWLNNILSGQFPYSSNLLPSGFPFLYILALPFYLLGDVGLFQIFGFITFAIALQILNPTNFIKRFRVIVLLLASPIFIYEIVVRSELFANISIVLFFIAFVKKYCKVKSIKVCITIGIIAGLILSTRGIVLLVYIVAFGHYFRENIKCIIISSASAIVSLLLTLLPFALWNFEKFLKYGPFTIQASYTNPVILTLLIFISVLFALTSRRECNAYLGIAILLFIAVFIPFVSTLFQFGWSKTIFEDIFDISYFAFAMPFILICIVSAIGSKCETNEPTAKQMDDNRNDSSFSKEK